MAGKENYVEIGVFANEFNVPVQAIKKIVTASGMTVFPIGGKKLVLRAEMERVFFASLEKAAETRKAGIKARKQGRKNASEVKTIVSKYCQTEDPEAVEHILQLGLQNPAAKAAVQLEYDQKLAALRQSAFNQLNAPSNLIEGETSSYDQGRVDSAGSRGGSNGGLTGGSAGLRGASAIGGDITRGGTRDSSRGIFDFGGFRTFKNPLIESSIDAFGNALAQLPPQKFDKQMKAVAQEMQVYLAILKQKEDALRATLSPEARQEEDRRAALSEEDRAAEDQAAETEQ